MLISSGLNVIELIEEEMVYSFTSKKQLSEFFNASGSQIKHLPADKKTAFVHDFINDYLKELKCTDENSILLSFWCLQVQARKI